MRAVGTFDERWTLLLLAAAIVVALALTLGAHAGPASPVSVQRLQVGLVSPTTGNQDPFARAAIAGLERAVRELGAKAEVRTPTSREGYAASLTEFAKLGYDLVISVGPPELGVRPDLVAPRFPRVRFASLDSSRHAYRNPPPNMTGIVFRREEAGYLAGYLAALVERQKPKPHVISAVGGIPEPGVDRFIAGYRAGARRADPRIRILYGYSNSFTAPERCATVASSQIAKGSDVVFNVAGGCGPGALHTARKHHVWGIGVDTDQASFGPHILTSAVLRVGAAVFGTIRALQQHRYRSGVDLVVGLRQNAVGLGRISPKVPRPLITRVRRVRRLIAEGKINVPATLPH